MRRPTIFPFPERAFFLLLPLLSMNWAVTGPALSAADRPNILLIVTDDQGYWDLGATGNSDIETPNMDSLARDGVQFRRFYVAPVCAPTDRKSVV